MGEKALSHTTYDTYLTLEAESEVKYEYHDGFVVAMAGGTPTHSLICSNAGRFIGNALDAAGKNCKVYNSDLKVRIESVNRTYYPDVTVACEEPQFSEKDANALINPTLLIEVLSKSSEAVDRIEKFHYYRELTSFQEYVLISQVEPKVITHYYKGPDLWEFKTVKGLDQAVPLQSLGCEVQMKDLYRMVDWK